MIQVMLKHLRKVRQCCIKQREELERLLSDGVEAGDFLRATDGWVAVIHGQLAEIGKIRERLSGEAMFDSVDKGWELIEEEIRASGGLLEAATAAVSKQPRPVDWKRVRAAEEAHSRNETKPFSKQ